MKTISPHILRISRRQSASKISHVNILRALSLIPPLSHPSFHAPFEHHHGIVDPLPSVSKSPRMKGSEEKEIWIDTRILLVKDPSSAPLIFLARLGASQSNKLDSSNSTPIVHSPFYFSALKRKGFEGTSRFRNCQSFPRLFHRSILWNIFLRCIEMRLMFKKRKKKNSESYVYKSIREKNRKERKKGKRIGRWNIELPFKLSTFSGV